MIVEYLATALSSMKSHKMQTFLTLLGIIIGISSATTITTLGNSVKYIMNSVFESNLSGDMLAVGVISSSTPLISVVSENEIPESEFLTEEMISDFTEKYSQYIESEILMYSDDYNQKGYLKDTSGNFSVNICAVSANYFSDNFNMTAGRVITESDCSQEKCTILIPETIASNYSENVIGKTFSVRSNDGKVVNYVIAGVYEDTFGGYNIENTYTVYVPYTYYLKAYNLELDRSSIYASWYFTCDSTKTSMIKEAANHYFSKYYENNDEYTITVSTTSEYLKTFSDVVQIITYIISILAGFSLIIGGVGIMNVMLVSVSERVNEIGIRKSLGAKNKNILAQFLIETVVISFSGGFLGVIIGLFFSALISLVIPSIMTFVTITPLDLMHPNYLIIVIALLLSILLGIFFGVYPAFKAARMNPVDALRK